MGNVSHSKPRGRRVSENGSVGFAHREQEDADQDGRYLHREFSSAQRLPTIRFPWLVNSQTCNQGLGDIEDGDDGVVAIGCGESTAGVRGALFEV